MNARRIGFALGLVGFLLTVLLPAPGGMPCRPGVVPGWSGGWRPGG